MLSLLIIFSVTRHQEMKKSNPILQGNGIYNLQYLYDVNRCHLVYILKCYIGQVESLDVCHIGHEHRAPTLLFHHRRGTVPVPLFTSFFRIKCKLR